ncbi:hypothetical protein ACHAQJ_010399 [Trichoderma viride]
MLLEQAALEPQKTCGKWARCQRACQFRAAPKKFEFITSDSVGRPPSNARALIRSHVMRGKNIKEHRIPKIKPPLSRATEVAKYDEREKVIISVVSAQLPISTNQARSRADIHAFIVTLRDCGNKVAIVSSLLLASPLRPPHDLTLFNFASKLNDSSRTLLYRYFTTVKETMYPANWCVESDNFNLRFFRWLFEAESYLQSILFGVSAFQDILSIGSAKSMKIPVNFSPMTRLYMGKTIHLLQEQIQDCRMQLHDSTVAVIISLAMIADAVGDTTACKTHVDGLKQIVNARGGLRSFRSNRHIQMKICRFASIDLGRSLKSGSQSDFFMDDLSWDSHFDKVFPEQSIPEPDAPLPTVKMLHKTISQKLFTVLLDMQRFSQLVNTFVNSQNKLQIDFFQETMLSIQYRLLYLSYSFDTQFLDEAVRIGLLAYQAFIFLYIPGSNSRYDFLAKRFHYIIYRLDDSTIEAANFKLWMLFIGSFVSFDIGEHSLGAMIAQLTVDSDWALVRSRLKDIMWIDAVHDVCGKAVFEAAHAVPRSDTIILK